MTLENARFRVERNGPGRRRTDRAEGRGALDVPNPWVDPEQDKYILAVWMHAAKVACNIGCRELDNPDLSDAFKVSSARISRSGHTIDAALILAQRVPASGEGRGALDVARFLSLHDEDDGAGWPCDGKCASVRALRRLAQHKPAESQGPDGGRKRQRIDWSNVVVDEGDEAP